MEETLSPPQATRQMDTLKAFYGRIRKRDEERWLEHADTVPRLRVWLANRLQPLREGLHATRDALRATRKYGDAARHKVGLSRPTQVLHQLRIFREGRVPAMCYYALRMYDPAVRSKARFFVGDRFAARILHQLAQAAPEQERKPLTDKAAFFRHCRDHTLPTVPVLAIFKDGTVQQDYAGIRNGLPAEDLFSKPVTGFLGEGAQTWPHEGDGFRTADGHVAASSTVLKALKRQSNDRGLLLQPRVSDHPRLQALTGGSGPSTLRIVTTRRPGQPPAYFTGFLTTPAEEVPAPTFTEKTGLAAHVDPDTGRLGPPRLKQPDYLLEDHDQYPTTGRRMRGVALPDWDEAKALALRAHATLPHICCVGWDLMLTPDGPRLLEGNHDCSATLSQITSQRLLGLTRFSSDVCAHLQSEKPEHFF